MTKGAIVHSEISCVTSEAGRPHVLRTVCREPMGELELALCRCVLITVIDHSVIGKPWYVRYLAASFALLSLGVAVLSVVGILGLLIYSEEGHVGLISEIGWLVLWFLIGTVLLGTSGLRLGKADIARHRGFPTQRLAMEGLAWALFWDDFQDSTNRGRGEERIPCILLFPKTPGSAV